MVGKKRKLKNKLLKKLQLLMSKENLSDKDRKEITAILEKLDKKTGYKIQSEKLNNTKQNETTVFRKGRIQNGEPNAKAKDIYNGDKDLSDLNMGHLTSTTGSYRKGRIDNRKQ